MKDIIRYIKENNLPEEKAIEYLGMINLENEEKNIIFVYCFPRPLKDRELPERCQKTKSPKHILLIEASQTLQYRRFIQHLLHAFTDSSDNVYIDQETPLECPVCGSKDGIIKSSQTSLGVCKDCMENLLKARNILDDIEPGFMNWIKRL